MSGLFYCSIENIDNNYEKAFLSSGFLYGEAPFTTGIVSNKELLFREYHEKRISTFINYMNGGNTDIHLNRILVEVDDLLTRLDDRSHYFRITLFKTLNNELEFFLWAEPRDPDPSNLKLSLKLSQPEGNYPHYLKLANYSFSFKVRKEVQADGFDDVLFYDDQNNILDLSTSSIVFIGENHIDFIELIPGVLDSISTSRFKEYVATINKKISHKKVKLNQLSDYIGAIAFNAFTGPRIVDSISDVNYLKNEEVIKLVNDFIKFEGAPWQIRN